MITLFLQPGEKFFKPNRVPKQNVNNVLQGAQDEMRTIKTEIPGEILGDGGIAFDAETAVNGAKQDVTATGEAAQEVLSAEPDAAPDLATQAIEAANETCKEIDGNKKAYQDLASFAEVRDRLSVIETNDQAFNLMNSDGLSGQEMALIYSALQALRTDSEALKGLNVDGYNDRILECSKQLTDQIAKFQNAIDARMAYSRKLIDEFTIALPDPVKHLKGETEVSATKDQQANLNVAALNSYADLFGESLQKLENERLQMMGFVIDLAACPEPLAQAKDNLAAMNEALKTAITVFGNDPLVEQIRGMEAGFNMESYRTALRRIEYIENNPSLTNDDERKLIAGQRAGALAHLRNEEVVKLGETAPLRFKENISSRLTD